MTSSKEPINFEAALEELNHLVAEMEQGGLSVEKSLQYFEKGVRLTKQCQKELQEAEQKVQVLLEKNGDLSLNPYLPEE
jgi:exodeoxyribonuclease VII small subunit